MTSQIENTPTPDRRELLRHALDALEKMQKKLEASEQARREPIAVIGLGCRLPGGVKTPEQYWDLLVQGRDAVTRMPEQRWRSMNPQRAGSPALAADQAPWGGFLDGIDRFDASFFRISRREAESMDPQQRLLLEVSWEAIERAGIDAASLRGSKTGVFVGVTTTDYAHIALNQDPALLDAYTATGSALNVTAGRIAYVLGLNGPAMAIDTACSSSLVALHLASQSLRLGETDLALAGGVNALLKPEPFICFAKWGMMAPDGRCKTFDAAANGFVRSEGCGMLVLKRLSDALAAGDNILALLKGSAVNQDGASSGLTVPSGRAQAAVITAALKAAGLAPGEIDYVEAHGTGTSLGDPIELEAIVDALCAARDKAEPLRVGSVKTNLGHLESASGVAGLIKVILSLNHGIIPPHLNFKTINPQVNIENALLEIPTGSVSWARRARPRRAGVSSFGFSGTNAHILVEEAPEREPDRPSERACEIVCLSANSLNALEKKARELVDSLGGEPEPGLPQVSYTLTAGRKHMNHRLAMAGSDIGSVRQALQNWLGGSESKSVRTGECVEGKTGRVAFLFSGQGSQYAGMGKTLYETQPLFKETVDRCSRILNPMLELPLTEVIFAREKDTHRVDETIYTQPALFVIEYALAELLREWGIRPAVVMGHSVGEYVAACVAGVFGLEDGLRMVAARARLMAEKTERGQMAAVFASEAAVASAIAPMADEVAIAAFNGPQNVVISGRTSTMAKVLADLERRNIRFKILPVSHAFHSPLMEPMLPAYYEEALKTAFSPPGVKWISNIDGKPVPSESIPDADYWCRHIRRPVRFDASVQSLVNERCDGWLEIGPHPVLLAMARQNAPDADCLLLPTLRRQQSDWTSLTESMAALYSRGWNIHWKSFHANRALTTVQLPTYPFEQETFWISAGTQASSTEQIQPDAGYGSHPLLGARLNLADAEGVFVWQAALDLRRCSFLLDHCVQGSAIFPATAYIEMVLAAASEILPAGELVLRDASFHKPLRLTRDSRPILQLWMREASKGSFTLRVSSRNSIRGGPVGANPPWTLHMTCILAEKGRPESEIEKMDAESIRMRCREEVQGAVFYEQQAHRGNQWGPFFQGVQMLWKGEGEALSLVEISPGLQTQLSDYQFHPAVADFCGHALAATLPIDDAGRRAGAFVGGSIGEIRFYAPPVGPRLWSHARLRKDDQAPDNVLIGDVRVWDDTGKLVSETLGAQLWYLDQQSSRQTTDIRRWMHEIAWVPADEELAPVQDDLSGQRWVIFADDSGVGDALERHVTQRGAVAYRIAKGVAYQSEGELHWTIRPLMAEDYRRLLEQIQDDGGHTRHKVIYLWNLDAPDPDGLTAERMRDWQLVGCGGALYLIQAMAALAQMKTAELFLISRGVHALSGQRSSLSPAQASVWGLGRTAAIEHAQFWGGLIDLDPGAPPESSAVQLVQAIQSRGQEDQILLNGGRTFVARLQPLPDKPSPHETISIHGDGSYLITGGLGGIGFETAHWLARKGARHLLLVGRTPLPDRESWGKTEVDSRLGRRLERLRTLERLGVKVFYFCGDAADTEVVNQIQSALTDGAIPELKGIVHAAGIMQYETLASHNAERMLEVMRAKIIGGWLLHSSFRDQPIDLFVMFSSTASMLNSPFMGAYAASNTFLDALAAYRRCQGLPALSISWGTWSETGMAVEGENTAANPRTLSKGVGTISNQQGLEALEMLLTQHVVHAGVIPMEWDEWQRNYPSFASRPFFRHLMKADAANSAEDDSSDLPGGRRAGRADAAEKPANLEDYLRREIAVVLRTGLDKVPVNVPLPSLGFDSLMAVEIKNRVANDLQVEMPMVALLEGQSITYLADFISQKLAAGAAVDRDREEKAVSGIQDGSAIGAESQPQAWEEGEI